MKIGSFFTLSGFLLVSLVLVLSILFSNTLKQSNERLIESGSLERVRSLDRSLEKTIRSIDNGITVNIGYTGDIPNNYDINITELINSTFDSYGTNVFNSFNNLKTYIESDQPEITINPEVIYNSKEKLPIVIKPYNLRYTHYNSSNKLATRLLPNITLSYMYNIYITFLEETIDQTKNIEWTTQNPGSNMEVFILAKDYTGYTTDLNTTISLNPNTFSVASCSIDFNSLSTTSMETECGNKAVRLSIITNPQFLKEAITAHYPAGLVVMNFSEFNIFENKTVRLI